MKSGKFILVLALFISTISCKFSNDPIAANEELREHINEKIKDSLRQDSIYKNEWAPMSKKYKDSVAQAESKESKGHLLGLNDLLSLYSLKDQDNKEILTALKKYNSKWSISTEGERSYENFYFIYSLLVDNDINKTEIINIDYKTNVLEYIFFDKKHIEEIIQGINKNNFEVYSVKKIQNGDVTSYVSKDYNISVKIKDGSTPDTKDCSIYIMKR
jgi:hypothetical protein